MQRTHLVPAIGGTAVLALCLTTITTPASAAPNRLHHYKNQGYEVTWGDDETMDSLQVNRVAAMGSDASSSEDAAIGEKILQNYLRLNLSGARGEKDPKTFAGDHCTQSPDSYGKANFIPACDAHDRCYSPNSSTARKACDDKLKSDMNKICNSSFSSWWETPDRKVCNGMAWTYYQFVRKYGGSFYHGKGNKS